LAVTLVFLLLIPAVRTAVGKYLSGFVQNYFDQKIEKVRSDFRQSEEKFASDLRASEQKIRLLAETTLSLRSTRQVALDSRRLQAVEKLWAAKTATDRMKMAANLVSRLNLPEVFTAAEAGEERIKSLGEIFNRISGFDVKESQPASAQLERPFLSSDVWQIFSAYQGVMVHSAVIIHALANGTTELLNKEDTLKPLMILALPEYKTYIEQYGFSSYYNLLDILEQKLLNSIAEMLDGNGVDDATLKRSAEILSAASVFNSKAEPEIPAGLQGLEIPPPPEAN